MDQEVRQAAARVASKLLRFVLDDPDLRADLHGLADALQQFGTPAGPEPRPAAEEVASHDQSPAANETVESQTPPPPRPQEPLPELTLGRTASSSGSKIEYDPEWALPSEPTLDPVVAQRCRLKAQAMRFVADRMKSPEFGPDLKARYHELVRAADNVQPCFLWMLHYHLSPTITEEVAHLMGHGYEAMAEVLEVAAHVDVRQLAPSALKALLGLIAESQSALRAILLRHGQERDDDQLSVYTWVREMTQFKRVYIERFMRADDQADPTLWELRIRHAQALKEELSRQGESARTQRKRLDNLRYKLRHREGDPRIDDEEWSRIAVLVHEIVEQGMPASAVELRELLLPVVDQLPLLDELPAGFAQVLESLDRYRTEQQKRLAEEEEADESTTVAPQVAEAAALLAGKALVLIGGDERPHIRKALISALQLSDLYWVPTRSHESIDGFEPWVRRGDVAAVLLAIRWASHSYGDVHRFCKRYGKPLVRLPRGCNPNQVAAEILRQCSRTLTMSTVKTVGAFA